MIIIIIIFLINSYNNDNNKLNINNKLKYCTKEMKMSEEIASLHTPLVNNEWNNNNNNNNNNNK